MRCLTIKMSCLWNEFQLRFFRHKVLEKQRELKKLTNTKSINLIIYFYENE